MKLTRILLPFTRRHLLAAAAALAVTPLALAGAEAKEVEVVLEVSDSLAYSKTQIEVPAGSTVKLTLKHTGKMAKEAMGHNFVLLAKGAEMQKVAMAAMGAAADGYIPKDMKAKIIAHTKIIGGGESDTITFAAPEKGTYTFFCSFPGHYTVMNGKLTVK